MILSPDQERALAAVEGRIQAGARTTMLAGAAGTGKTTESVDGVV